MVVDGKQVNQSIPIVLPVNDADKERISGKDAIVLIYKSKPVAILRNIELFPHRKEERCCRQWGTNNTGHPYIKVLEFVLASKVNFMSKL